MSSTGSVRSRPSYRTTNSKEQLAKLAVVMASKSPVGLRLAKESLNRVEDLGLKDGYRTEQDYTQRITKFEDSAEARRSYLEKREPEWQWR